MATAEEVRGQIVEALELDLVGPWPGHALEREALHVRERPSNWYLTGFLVPVDAPEDQAADAEAEDELEEAPEREGPAAESAEERAAAKKSYFPSSMGLSTLVAPGTRSLTVTVRWGDYARDDLPVDAEHERPLPVWQRSPRESHVAVTLGESGSADPLPLPGSGGLELQVLERLLPDAALHDQLPAGTRAVSVFLVNRRRPSAEQPDAAFVFQPEVEVTADVPFVGRPDLRGANADEWDEQVADLHYADTPEYATGHGVAADWTVVDGQCRALRTRWIPRAEVEATKTRKLDDVELGMRALGALADGSAVRAALNPLVAGYREWITQRAGEIGALGPRHRETAEQLLHHAGIAAGRIQRGVEVLAGDADALDAFRVANRAVAAALEQRLKPDTPPAWRPFQLAFILLNLPGLADEQDAHRETVDLLFFPTGGGKTEAYLGLSAFAMVLRRLRHPEAGGRAGGGVSVIMRYTLRLLTLDQLSRAAGLVCALELERERAAGSYGEWPFEIGLWVGTAATPNRMGRKGDHRGTAREKVRYYKNDAKYKPSPVPLEACPWCQTQFTPDSFSLRPDADAPRELRIGCVNFECDFTGDRSLPIVAVDEPLYRRLPAFVIATVDKFATLPWVGESGSLLGGATRHDAEGYYGAATSGSGALLPAPLPPPDLIIQDELHLIAGPLGTMAGLYETAIEALCARDGVRPKIVASTATVRRANDQIQALFARPQTRIFPPPGPDRRDSYFARTVTSDVAPARLYVGVGAQGRNPKVVMRKVWLALMGAAERAYREDGGHQNHANVADPYMTVLGYFNSLRELGGARRILEEEVQNTLRSYGGRRRVNDPQPLFRDRMTFKAVVELTSRVSTNQVAEARRRLGEPAHSEARVDCAIATNMISVGLDIGRLGLMGVLGQPKTASEYIQATSRVGRTDAAPGLVVTLLNVHKPRDRSHYERFRHFHDTFYRSVEVGSVTPFSARALDRGFAGALVALARHLRPALTPSRGAERIAGERAAVEQAAREVFRARVSHQKLDDEAERAETLASVDGRVGDLLDAWRRLAAEPLSYQRHERASPVSGPLLREMLDTGLQPLEAKFRVNRSLRDVEPSVNLYVKDL